MIRFNNLSCIRQNFGISLEEMSRDIYLSPTTLCRIESERIVDGRYLRAIRKYATQFLHYFNQTKLKYYVDFEHYCLENQPYIIEYKIYKAAYAHQQIVKVVTNLDKNLIKTLHRF